MADYTIEIPGELRGKARPRVTRNGTFTPKATLSAENWVRACALDAGVIAPLAGPLELSLTVERAVPASWSKKKRAQALVGEIGATGKPDLDNIVKLIGDALNGIAWGDDSQIVRLSVFRCYGERARAQITVTQR